MLTTDQLAKALGVSPRRVLAICKHRGIKPSVAVTRPRLWPAETVAALADRKPGRPAQPTRPAINARD